MPVSKPLLVDLDGQGSSTIRNVPDPVQDQDVATKKFVDDTLDGVVGGTLGIEQASDADLSEKQSGSTIFYNTVTGKWEAQNALKDHRVDGGNF